MADRKITKGMLLAAGMGTRLLPITETLPKPLVPVLNLPNILHIVFLLRRAGIRDLVINTFHLGDQLSRWLGNGEKYGVKISYSPETILLGTGGGVKHAESFFKGEPFVLCNSDFVTDVDIAPVLEAHRKNKALATMVLVDDAAKKKKYAPVGTTPAGNLCSLPKYESQKPARTGFFTGIHVLENSCLQYLKDEPSGINQVLYPQLMQAHPAKVFGEYCSPRFWLDTGEVDELLKTSLSLIEHLDKGNPVLQDLMECLGYRLVAPTVWAAPSVKLPADIELGDGILIGENCEIGEGVRLGNNTIVGDNSLIGASAKIENSCLLPGSLIQNHETLSHCLAWKAKRLGNLQK